jgi:hypothetical protein
LWPDRLSGCGVALAALQATAPAHGRLRCINRRMIVVAGVPLGTPGATNMLRIAFVGADAASD